MDEKSRAFIFGERLKDAPEIPQMTKEQMEECINETEEYIPKEDSMKLIDEHGNKIEIPNSKVPKEMKEWLYSSVQMFPDDTKLEKCWVAILNKQEWGTKITWEYVTEEVYDHPPTEEELLWLMAKNNALRFSYVEVNECYRLHEEDD